MRRFGRALLGENVGAVGAVDFLLCVAVMEGDEHRHPRESCPGGMIRSEQLPAFRRVAADLQIRIEFFTRITTPMAKG